MEVFGLLVSYTWVLGSNIFSILLALSSFSVQNSQVPKKKSKYWWPAHFTVSPGGSPASKWYSRRYPFVHPKETLEGIQHGPQLEKVSTGAIASISPIPLSRRMVRVHPGAEIHLVSEDKVSLISVETWASSQVSNEKWELPHSSCPLFHEHNLP